MKKKPRIAIGMNYHYAEGGIERAYLDRQYFDMLMAFEALPCPILPVLDDGYLETQLDKIDGVLLTGGRDLNPELWGEAVHEKTDLIHPRRQAFDLLLYQKASKRRLPIFGICLGLQVIAVAHGGSLYQHLPENPGRVDHGQSGTEVWHELILKFSHLPQLSGKLGKRISVPSLHHQGVNKAGPGLSVAGVAEDGIIEIVEGVDYPFLIAVQWHPERHFADHHISNILIDTFIQACQG